MTAMTAVAELGPANRGSHSSHSIFLLLLPRESRGARRHRA
jgi:hypothetical protein